MNAANILKPALFKRRNSGYPVLQPLMNTENILKRMLPLNDAFSLLRLKSHHLMKL